MSTNGDNITEDAEMAECDGDKVVTMMDVLQEQQEFEEDANAVLGASDDKNCTYPKGYIKRQALYACLTCCTEAKEDQTKRAGVCLACSLTCHESHELVELYTKRNFRCDCGNPKFNSHPCQFTPTKTDLNEDNIYNQNFSGLYCVCHRPYPDPEATFEDDMIQCIICEDWLHASHLEATVPSNDQYTEMICKGCMEKNEFLHDYTGLAVNVETDDVDIVSVNGNDSVACNGGLKINSEAANGTNEVPINTDVQMDANKVVEYAEPSVNSEAKAVEAPSKAANDTDIVMTDEVEKNKQNSENVETKESVDNIGSTTIDQEQKEVLSLENSVAQHDNEQTNEKNSAEADKLDENKEDDLPIGDNTQKSDDNNESTDDNAAKHLDHGKSNPIDFENGQSIKKPENYKDLETNEELENETLAPEQGTEQKLEEITTSKEQETPQAETIRDNIESNKGTEKSDDKQLSDKTEPTINVEKTEDQLLLDDLNELTSDKQDSEKTECQQDTDIEDKSETSDSQITKETEQNTDTSDTSTTENVENSVVKEPLESPENEGNSEAKEPMETEVTQSTEITNTSQDETTEKENNDKTDAVMSAIDEILEESSEIKSDIAEETIGTTEESKANDNETDTSIVTAKIHDVTNEENGEPSVVPEQTESVDIDNKVTEDIEMTDENEPQQIKNEVGKEMTESESKVIENEVPVNESKLSEAISNKETNETVDENSITKDSEIIETSDRSEVVTNNIENSIKEMPALIEAEEKSNNDNAISTDNGNKDPVLTESTNENKRKHDTESDNILSAKKAKLDGEKSCIRPENVKRIYKGATFWASNFRQKLCTCGECISMYKDLNVLFLTDIEDTVSAYESLGKENVGISQYEKGLEALSSLDRIQQINALTEYNKMRDKLLDFLKSFKDRKEIVKEEDIKAFFAGMKPKREPDGVYFCR